MSTSELPIADGMDVAVVVTSCREEAETDSDQPREDMAAAITPYDLPFADGKYIFVVVAESGGQLYRDTTCIDVNIGVKDVGIDAGGSCISSAATTTPPVITPIQGVEIIPECRKKIILLLFQQ